MHQRYPVAPRGLIHEMRRYENSNAIAARHLDEQAPKPVARRRIDAGRRLVKDQYFRPMQTGSGKLQPLSHAERQRRRQGVRNTG